MTAWPQAGDLLAWYDRHARRLPWRVGPSDSKNGHLQDPYKVWLSEIMLQQTTVAAVIPYFEIFTQRWPTVTDLAAASADDVRAAWAGLGYYRRAANLHTCAKVVAEKHRGIFPSTARALRDLPGIGDYTSAAIAAIAFGEPAAVVDGNVERVVTRLGRLDTPLPKVKQPVGKAVGSMVPQDRPGDFAQAMMDLGATICTPKQPACALCPWNENCAAFKQGDQEAYPVKVPKKAKPHRRGAAMVVVRADGAIWCEQRAETGLLPGMTQVPTTDWSQDEPEPFDQAQHVGQIGHVFTHFSLTLDVYRRDSESAPAPDGWWSAADKVREEAWPTVMVKVLKCAVPDLASGIRGKRG